MVPLKLSEIAALAGGGLSGPDGAASGLCIDSRKVGPGDLFVAVKGPRFDGHDFIRQALAAGAAGAVASAGWAGSRAGGFATDGIIAVTDTLEALHRFAENYRSRFDVVMIAITGTNGKTTTKEMIAQAAGASFGVLKNQGNLNNQYGLPLSLAGLGPEHQVAVMELGMSGFGEIALLCRLAKPQIGVITNVAEGHTQFLGDIGGVARAKGELLECLPPDGTAVLNADSDILMGQAARTKARVVTFGIERPATVKAESLEQRPGGVSFRIDGMDFELNLAGRHNVYNALAAVAVCDRLGLTRRESSRRLSEMRPVPMRQEILKLKNCILINDAYNANPESMSAALDTLRETAGPGRKVAVLADMLELGEIGPVRHREIGELAGRSAELVVAIGPLAAYINEGAAAAGADSRHFEDNGRAIPYVLSAIRPGDTLLVKGSRGMKLEEIVEAVKEKD
jgi:UDP-N-acetylmuramoyl-tripeptide--D-alanyl-D-alanine ligase